MTDIQATTADTGSVRDWGKARATKGGWQDHGGKVSAPEVAKADFKFSEILDVINPLQHIPIVGSIYRAITGDTISESASVIGGTIFGGPIGGAFAVASNMFQDTTGKSPTEAVIAALTGDDNEAPTTALAAAEEGKVPVPEGTPHITIPAPTALKAAAEVPSETNSHAGPLDLDLPLTGNPKVFVASASSQPPARPLAPAPQSSLPTPVVPPLPTVAEDMPITTLSPSLVAQMHASVDRGQKPDPQFVQDMMMRALQQYQAGGDFANIVAGTKPTMGALAGGLDLAE